MFDLAVHAFSGSVDEPPDSVAERRFCERARATDVDLAIDALRKINSPEGGGKMKYNIL